MGKCHSRIAPYDDNSRDVARAFLRTSSPTIIHCLERCRFAWLNAEKLSTEAINAEGLIDFALTSLYGSIVTTDAEFKEHYQICCLLLNHSSAIIHRLRNHEYGVTTASYIATANAREVATSTEAKADWFEDRAVSLNNFVAAENRHVEPNPLEDLFARCDTVQNHPLLKWSVLMKGDIPDDETVSQLFCLFRIYCRSILTLLYKCSMTKDLPPQTQYRTKVQKYDLMNDAPLIHATETKSIAIGLARLMELCEIARENSVAETVVQPQEASGAVPRHPSRVYSPQLETVLE